MQLEEYWWYMDFHHKPKTMQLTPNFSLEEMLASQTATRLGISEQFSTPPQQVIDNLKLLSENVLEPLEQRLKAEGKIIHVDSGYRCPRLNTAVHGKVNSQHLVGEAADITVRGLTNMDIMKRVKNSGITFDQMIEEYGQWVHISFRKGKNRMEILRATKNALDEPVYTELKI